MRAAGTPERFISDPIGHWVADRSVLIWSWSPALSGTVMWGRPSEEDFIHMYRLVDAYHAVSTDHAVVTDVSRIESVDDDAYRTLMRGMQERARIFATQVRRHAIIRTGGLVGGLAEGFNPLIEARHAWKTFDDARAAFSWIGDADAESARLEVEGLVDAAQGVPSELRRVRDYLKAHLVEATLLDAARSLGMSERTVQRVLKEAGTRFRDELTAARVEEAARLLAETPIKIGEIARRVGCSSHAHLTTLFKRAVQATPAEYRARRVPPKRDA